MFVSATSPIVLYMYKFAFKSFLLPLVLLSGRQKWRLVSKASENWMSLSYTKNQFAKSTYTRQYLPNIVLETVPFIWFYKWSSAKPNGHMYGKSPHKTYACRFYSHFYKKKRIWNSFFYLIPRSYQTPNMTILILSCVDGFSRFQKEVFQYCNAKALCLCRF